MSPPSLLRLALPWIAGLIILALLPSLFPSRTALSVMNAIGIQLVFALSYNMLLGQGGMLSFGHAVYFGLGGYGAMHVMGMIEAGNLDFPVFALPLVGFAVGLLAGAVIGWPSCRRAGVPFAMISLGIGELVAAAGFMFVSVFGGEEGIFGDRMVGPEVFGLSLGPIGEVYWFIAFWVFVATFAMWAFTRTPLGRLSNAVRDNPQRAEFIGFNPQRVRYLVFIASGGFAGLAGGMSAVNYEILTPETFSALVSGGVLIMAFIGGIGTFYGPILGAALIVTMQSLLSDYTGAWQLYIGILFMVIVMFAPGGLAGLVERVRLAIRRRELAALAPLWGFGTLAALAMTLGLIVLVELVFRWREGEEPMELLGVALSHQSVLAWVLAIGLIALGSLGLRQAPKRLGRLLRGEGP
ncbi:MAG: hypothetical protein Kilf2KO_43830 [Rhodospirillales bacterium]